MTSLSRRQHSQMTCFIEKSLLGVPEKTGTQLLPGTDCRCFSPTARPLPTVPCFAGWGGGGVKGRRPLHPLTLGRRSSFLGLHSEAEPGRDMF